MHARSVSCWRGTRCTMIGTSAVGVVSGTRPWSRYLPTSTASEPRQRELDRAPDLRLELLRAQDEVRVADLPELRRVAAVARRDVVEPLALRVAVLDDGRRAAGRRQEAAPLVRDLAV